MLEGLLTQIMSWDRDQEQQVPPAEGLQESCLLNVPVKILEKVSLRSRLEPGSARWHLENPTCLDGDDPSPAWRPKLGSVVLMAQDGR